MIGTHQKYAAETIGSVMTVKVPTCAPEDTPEDILRTIAADSWDSLRHVYVIRPDHVLLGFISLGSLAKHGKKTTAQELMRPIVDVLHPDDDQEKAVFLAVKDNEVSMPVVDDDGRLLGAVTARKVIGIMHNEHIEDALLASGVRDGKGASIAKLATERTGWIFRTRSPWLVVGLAVGLGLGLISSFFETSLQEVVALAYFIPVVAYIADSVGTQSEAIAVRALATLKINPLQYVFKELLVGLSLGAFLGLLGAIGAGIIAQSMQVGLVVGLSLAAASTIAAFLASSIPILFRAYGKDPALASGPLATALQDVISILIYFGFAAWLV